MAKGRELLSEAEEDEEDILDKAFDVRSSSRLGCQATILKDGEIEDRLVTPKFRKSIPRGFAAVGDPNVAVCLLPGTEIAFDENVECEPSFGIGILPNKKIGQRLARFRQMNMDNPVIHHDALEFPDGQVVLLTRLCVGQRATVLQLPAAARPEVRENEATREACEPSLSS